MITVKDAIKIVESKNRPYKVVGLAETDDMFLCSLNNDDEGCETVNKQTGEISFMWTWDYIELVESRKVRALSIE